MFEAWDKPRVLLLLHHFNSSFVLTCILIPYVCNRKFTWRGSTFNPFHSLLTNSRNGYLILPLHLSYLNALLLENVYYILSAKGRQYKGFFSTRDNMVTEIYIFSIILHLLLPLRPYWDLMSGRHSTSSLFTTLVFLFFLWSMEVFVLFLSWFFQVSPYKGYLSGCLSGSVGKAPNFGSGHDLMIHEFDPCVRLCADSLEPGGCFRFCVSLSLSAPPLLALCPSLSLKNK